MPRLFPMFALALLLASCGTQASAPTPSPVLPSPTVASTPVPATATATPPDDAALAAGVRIDIGGRALFIQCVGATGQAPTVLLEAGLGGNHSSWAQVQAAVAPFARACSYDRAGTGQSDPAPPPRNGEDSVNDLRALLEAASVPGPYLLVGHSFGGLFSRLFASRDLDQVVGVVLVDAVHEDWWARSLASLPAPAPNDSARLRGFRQFLTSELADPARNAEGLDIPAIAAEVRAADPLGRRPLVILTAGVFDVLAPGLPPDLQAKLARLFQQELPKELSSLSTDSTVVSVPDSGHNIPQQRPDIVVLAIQAVLAAISQGAPQQ